MQNKLNLFTKLVRLRLVEEYIAKNYAEQEMRCPVHLCLGQEAVSVGAVHALKKEDTLLGTHRSHGPYIASGASVEAMILELYGKAGGCCNGRGGSMHLMDVENNFLGGIPIVGSSLAIATGAALAHKMKKNNCVSMVVFGEAATEEGVFYESLQFAVLKKLPIVYVCENNTFSVNTPYEERRPKHLKIHEMVQAQGVQIMSCDGTNVFAVNELCQKAVTMARENGEPIFLEFETYRYMEHCGPNDDHHLPCRSLEELEKWKLKDPLVVAEKELCALNIEKSILDEIYHDEKQSILKAFKEAKTAPFPQQKMKDMVYSI